MQNDPVNFVDPSGLILAPSGGSGNTDALLRAYWGWWWDSANGGWDGWGGFGDTGRHGPPAIEVGDGGTPQNPADILGPPPPDACELKLAGIFGGPGSVMRTALDVDGQYRGRNRALVAQVGANPRGELGNPRFNAEHLYNFPHLSGNMAGTANTQIYVPGNYERGSVTGPTRGDAVVTIYYPQLNATLAIFHVGDFGVQREGGRVTIGRTGGRGGGTAGNLHSHFELWRGRTGFLPPGATRDAARIPFTSSFCP